MVKDKKKNHKKPPKTPVVDISISEEDDRLFRESFAEFADPGAGAGDLHSRPPQALRSPRPSTEIDLHGMTLEEACREVDRFISGHISRKGGPVRLRIITGKGLHSGPGGSTLPRGVHSHVRSKFRAWIDQIDDSPDDVAVGGIPIRGYFMVTIGRR